MDGQGAPAEELIWRGAMPVSARYDDPYFSPFGGGGAVRRAAGFTVNHTPGFSGKRHMTTGRRVP